MTILAEAEGGGLALELEREEGKANLVETVERLAAERERIIVLIAGGSCSGKTTAARELAERFGTDALLVPTDSYYHGRSRLPDLLPPGHHDNFDHPDAVELDRLAADLRALREGRVVEMPNYQFDTAERAEPVTVGPKPIIIVEGLYALSEPLRSIGPDYGVFFDASRHGKFIRRLKREAGGAERDTRESVYDIVARIAEMVEPMYERYVEPTRAHADLIVRNDYTPEESAELPRVDQLKLRCPEGFALPEPYRTGRAVRQVDHYFFDPAMAAGETLRMRKEGSGPDRTMTLSYRVSGHERLPLFRGHLSAEVSEDVSGLLERLYGSRLFVEKRRTEYAPPCLEGGTVHVDTDVEARSNGRRAELGTFAEFSAVGEITPVEALRLERSVGRAPEDIVNRSYYQLAREALVL
ncbi:MAG TPA: hypothetical protein VIF43_04345 [Patescibacteria group bacterium]|jgi:uridine kinase